MSVKTAATVARATTRQAPARAGGASRPPQPPQPQAARPRNRAAETVITRSTPRFGLRPATTHLAPARVKAPQVSSPSGRQLRRLLTEATPFPSLSFSSSALIFPSSGAASLLIDSAKPIRDSVAVGPRN